MWGKCSPWSCTTSDADFLRVWMPFSRSYCFLITPYRNLITKGFKNYFAMKDCFMHNYFISPFMLMYSEGPYQLLEGNLGGLADILRVSSVN